MKKEKMLSVGAYSAGLVVGSAIGVIASTNLLPGIPPVILGSVGATIFGRFFSDLYKSKLSEAKTEKIILEAEKEINGIEDNFNFFKKNKR